MDWLQDGFDPIQACLWLKEDNNEMLTWWYSQPIHYWTIPSCWRSCSHHRSIFSHESMPPPSDSPTHCPIRGRAHWFHLPLKNFFLIALFGSLNSQRAPSWQQRKTPHELPATVNIFYPLKNQHTTSDTKTNLFSLWLKIYFCYKNKPIVVMFQRSFVIYFVLQINL